MAEGVELATAYVTIIPSLKGAGKSISSQLGGIDLSQSGVTIGKSLTAGMSKGISTDSLSALNDAVSSAESSVSNAMRKSEQSAKQLEVAQKRLAEAREKYGDDSSQAAQAELNLMTAQTRAESAAKELEDAQNRLADAQDRATEGAKAHSSALLKLSSVAMSVGDGLKTAGSKVESLGNAVMPVSSALIAGGAAAGAFALKTASAAETTEISFTTMLGSEEAALSMMEELADFAAHTPFELSGLQTATRQLLAYGFTAEDVIPMLTAVGDATAALGTGQAGIESVTRALGQMQTRGKVSAEEMLQLTEAGIPAWEYLARAIGTDTAGAMEAVSDGAVSASDGIAALTKGMEQDFGGMMEEQSKTVEGLFSNLSDAIEQPLMKLRESDAYERFADSLSDVVDSAGPFVESLLPHMEDGLDAVSGVLDAATDAMDSFSSMSEEGQDQIIGMATAAAAAGPALTVMGKGMQLVGTVTKTAGSLLSGATSAFGGLATGVVGLGAALGGLAIASVVSNLADMAEHERLVEDATASASDIIGDASESVGEYAEKLGSVESYTDGTLEAIAGLNDELSKTVSEQAASSAELDHWLGVIESLAGQSNLTASEQERLTTAVENYNRITGASVEVTDAANGELSESVENLKKSAEAWDENARAQAYAQAAQGYYEELAQAQLDHAKAQDAYNATLTEQNNRLADAKKAYDDGMMSEMEYQAVKDDATAKIQDASTALDEQTAAMDEAAESAEYLSTQSAILGSTLDTELKDALTGLPEQMQQGGYDIAMSLADGIEAGSVTTGQAVSFIERTVQGSVSKLSESAMPAGLEVANQLAAGISSGSVSVDAASSFMRDIIGSDVASLPPEMQAQGLAAAQSLASGVSSGQITVDQAATIIDAAITGNLSTLPPELQGIGGDAVANLASAIGQTGGVSASSEALGGAATSGVSGVPAEMSSDGYLAGQNFASGIGSAEGATSGAAGSLASAAGDMKNVGDTWTWGYHAASNFASGLSGAVGLVAGAAASVAAQAAAYLKHSTPAKGPLSNDDVWGLHLGQNLAGGMMRAVPDVERASLALADAAYVPDRPAGYRSWARPYAASGAAPQTVYNISVDGSAIDASPQLKAAFQAFMGALVRQYDMGVTA